MKAKSEISIFRQGVDESFCETCERFKMMLRKCPNHGFEDIAQLSIFHNGLRFDTNMLLNAAVGGTIMTIDVEKATEIIEVMISTNYQAQNYSKNGQRRG